MESFLTIKLEVTFGRLPSSKTLFALVAHVAEHFAQHVPDSPGFGPVPGVASVAPVSLSPPALAHLGLASQIYAWMAAQVAGPGLNG